MMSKEIARCITPFLWKLRGIFSLFLEIPDRERMYFCLCVLWGLGLLVWIVKTRIMSLLR